MNKIETHIKGFDSVIGGGLPKDQIILLSGSAGAMKSSVSFYILYKNALENGRTSIYVCLEEEKEAFTRNMRSYGMNLEKTSGKIVMYDAGDRTHIEEMGEQLRAVGWTEVSEANTDEPVFLQNLKYAIKKTKERNGAELLVIDSLDSLMMLSEIDHPRDLIFRLFEWLRELGLTTIIIGETPTIHPILIEGEGYSEDFLADGIIQLKMEKINDMNYRRYIRCVKMRAGEHSPDFFILNFDSANNLFEVTKALY